MPAESLLKILDGLKGIVGKILVDISQVLIRTAIIRIETSHNKKMSRRKHRSSLGVINVGKSTVCWCGIGTVVNDIEELLLGLRELPKAQQTLPRQQGSLDAKLTLILDVTHRSDGIGESALL